MKRIFKILLGVLLVIIVLLFLIPVIFEGKIVDMVKKMANESVNATLDFDDADISLLSSFPNIDLELQNITLANKAPFEGDTLFSAASVRVKMPIKTLMDLENISVKHFAIEEALLNIRVDKDGNANYDIAIEEEESVASENTKSSSETISFDLESYAITNSSIVYDDAGEMILRLTNFNHTGSGNLSLSQSELTTKTTSEMSFEMDSVQYLGNNKVNLDAILGIDLEDNKYTFLDNKALINQLPLEFDGYIKLLDEGQEMDITFKTPSSDFKNFLALIPEVYSKSIEGVKTQGNFDVAGFVKGTLSEERIPAFNVVLNADNASFKYPDLPKELKGIFVDAKIINETGHTEDTEVEIHKLSFVIDEDRFHASAKMTDVVDNMKVNAALDGKIDLAKLEQIYPAEGLKDLKGIFKADVQAAFDMASLEKEQYENIRSNGVMSLSGFEYESDELSAPLQIDDATLTFNPQKVTLNTFDAKLGNTDFQARGTIDNLLGYIFNDENIEGDFKLSSNTFSLNDFMVTEEEAESDESSTDETISEEMIKIPAFLDCTILANANTVIYDNLELKNVKGELIIKDETAQLKNMSSEIFGGTLGFSGDVSTKTEIPVFHMNLDIDQFNIAESFTSLELFQKLAPIANVVNGKINTDLSLSGNLNDDFTPDLSSLNGDMLAELLSSALSTEQTPLLQKLESNVSFIDTKNLNLDDLKTSLSFEDGKVTVKPFIIKYQDIEVEVSGSHGFDTSLDYNAVMNVPAKYLGSEAEALLSQLQDNDADNIKVPVTALITGNYLNPDVSTDIKSAVSDLAKQVAGQQKNKLIDKGKEEVSGVLGSLIGGKDEENNDTIESKSDASDVKEAAKNVLGGLLGKKKKDTIN